MTGFYEAVGETGDDVFPHKLNDHIDVTLSGEQDDDVLSYDQATNQWINKPLEAGEPPTLASLPDTNIPSPSDQQVLTYNAGSSLWVAATISGTGDPIGMDDLIDATITDPTNGDRLVYDGGQWVNTSSSNTTANPVTIGDGTDGTNAGLILNSGGTDTTDKGYIDFWRNGIPYYTIEGLQYQGANALAITSEVPNSAINLKALGPGGEQYDLTVGTNGDLAFRGIVIADGQGLNAVALTGDQTIDGIKTFNDEIIALNSVAVTGNVASSTLIPAGRLLQAGNFGIIEVSPYTNTSFLSATDNTVVKTNTTQTISGVKTFSSTTTTFQSVSANVNIAAGNLGTQGRILQAGQFGIIEMSSYTAASFLLASDSTVVKTNTTQTITGTKTFTATTTSFANVSASGNLASSNLTPQGRALRAGAFGIIEVSPSAFTEEQQVLVREVLVELADLLNIPPAKRTQFQTYLTSKGL